MSVRSQMIRSLKWFSNICAVVLLIESCAPQSKATAVSPKTPTVQSTQTPLSQHLVTESPLAVEPTKPISNINPLTGLAVEDPSLLDLPAALVSIAHFPPAARPQSGLSFAP